MNNPTRLEKFQQLIRVLSNIQDDNFDLHGWTNIQKTVDPEKDVLIDKTWIRTCAPTDINICGTTACAIGHAGTDKWFNDQKFFLALALSDFPNMVGVPIFINGEEECQGWYAIGEFFKIDYMLQHKLFSSNYYVLPNRGTKQDVINRVQILCNELEQNPTKYPEDQYCYLRDMSKVEEEFVC